MRNMLKKLMTIFTAGALAVTAAASLAGCAGNFKTPSGIPGGEVNSNGGFIVEVGDYFYFINGVESYNSDNTYGSPVKGALMRIRKNALEKNEAETVIPSLMTAGDYSSGIFIYGERVYYATPNNVKNTAGQIERDYLDFKSARLDGTDIQSYFNVSSNSTVYRYVESEGTVYLVTVRDSNLYSYNTKTKAETELARGMGEYLFNSSDKEDPYVYYTMGVTMDLDISGGSLERKYNQVYRVRADVTECPYDELKNYEWNQEYLDENNGEVPYLNLGELVLDGIGAIYQNNPTIFSHDVSSAQPLTAAGYTYDLLTYTNEGVYFTRKDLTTTGTVGEDGWLYYLPASRLGSGWNSVSGNAKENLDVVAQPSDTSYANDSAIFYLENGTHHYLYVSGSNLLRADVDEEGIAQVTRIVQGVGSATLVSIEESSSYRYVYYVLSGTGGNTIHRVVYNGTEEDYKSLGYEANKPYRPVQVLNAEHAKSWYNFEILDGKLFFADAETIGSNSYNYVAYIDLMSGDRLMDNVALSDYNDRLNETLGEDGILSQLSEDDMDNLSMAVKYYFYTGATEQFYENIEEAQRETGKENTIYSEKEVEEFREYTQAGHDVRSDFIHEIGVKTEEDQEQIQIYWRNTLEHYIAPAETPSEGLPGWAWALIGIGIAVVVLGVAAAVVVVVLKGKREEAPAEEKMFVDTTDDRSVDVYSEPEETEPAQEEPEETEPAQESEPEEPSQEEPEETEPAEEGAEETSEDKDE